MHTLKGFRRRCGCSRGTPNPEPPDPLSRSQPSQRGVERPWEGEQSKVLQALAGQEPRDTLTAILVDGVGVWL